MCFKKYLANRQMERRIRRLSEAERQAILTESPFELGLFQGEGFHVFLKNEPDYDKGYVSSLGEISTQAAEDWVITQYLLAKNANQ